MNESRMNRVNAARERWKEKLFDLGRRNNLLYFRDLKTGTLRLSTDHIHTKQFQDFIGHGSSLDLDRLLNHLEPNILSGKLRTLRDQARANREEKGLDTLYLGLGLATWHTDDLGRAPSAPLWLIPVAVEMAGTSGTKVTLKPIGDPTMNPLLIYVLGETFGIRIGADDDNPKMPPSLSEAIEQVMQSTQDVPDFHIEEVAVLGNFSFQKLAMVEDLTKLGDILVANDVIAALAGDEEAQMALRPSSVSDPELSDLDHVSPADDYTVLDADSSQLRVIRSVVNGRTGVISGPPGTGKSQTIANILAECAARGKSVLFVAEKRAALDVVLGRLREVGLEHLALDLEGADRVKQRVASQMGDSLTRIRAAQDIASAPLQRAFQEKRDQLDAYVKALHQNREPWNLSVYDMYAKVLATPQHARTTTRLDLTALDGWNSAAVEDIKRHLDELGSLEDVHHSAWFRLHLHTTEDVSSGLAAVGRLSDTWRRFHQTWMSAGEPLDHASFGTLAEWMQLSCTTRDLLSQYRIEIYDADVDTWEEALSSVRGTLGQWVHGAFDSRYRETVKQLTAYQLLKTRPKQPLEDVRTVKVQRAAWAALGYDKVPLTPETFPTLEQYWQTIQHDVQILEKMGLSPQHLSLREWTELLDELATDSVTPHQVLASYQHDRYLREQGLSSFLDDITARDLPPNDWITAFSDSLYRSALDKILVAEPHLAQFSRTRHEKVMEEFRALDQERIVVNSQRVIRMHAERTIATLNAHQDQEIMVRQEAHKKSHHLPLRKFLQQAPDALLALRPCWVASPLQVSHLLAKETLFDLVLFDEASQVLPEDAVPAMARGRQVVVAGDRHQLPPTSFFTNSLEEDEGDPEAYEGFESLLDMMSGVTGMWPLEWHYRSRDERLIAFSNHHIYSDSLVTFPGRGALTPLEHVVVPQEMGAGDDTESVAREAAQVASMIIQHATRSPEQSLGVITMGIKHANRVQMALESQLRDHPEVQSFFDDTRQDHFFIKNLERVQGDERDVIILSIGYGKDAQGRLPYRFGPLLQDGGERRLNVAVTRSRYRMIVVSSFNHQDMDPERKSSRGVALLREFLQYASTGGDILRDSGLHESTPLNAFELMVKDALEARGLSMIPQWGVSRYRLDFAVRHPEKPGQFVLAIECDGASYHSAPSARDRDRLRQQHLESLGWRFHRIWSTEWFRDPAREISRAVDAYEAALKEVGATTGELRRLPPVPHARANTPPPVPMRGPKPSVSQDLSIDRRSDTEMRKVLTWIQSDGQLRTDEELIQEMMTALGYKRRGPKIESRIHSVIQSSRRSK